MKLRHTSVLAMPFLCASLLVGSAALAGAAEPAAASARQRATEALLNVLDNKYYKINLDIRARVELADFETLESSQAYTIRTRAGIGNKPLYGFTAYAELENTIALADGQYFDTVEKPTGQSPIPDPENTDLHQLYARYQNAELLGADLMVGRQRINLDDQRFIGTVAWRQNEQVYDAVWASTSLGVDALSVAYGYVDYVTRIFGNDGPPATRNYRSDSHLIHAAYDRWNAAHLTAFAYLLDFSNSDVNSANSYGLRVYGSVPATPTWTLSYAGSYALQTDAGDNPVNYLAHYVAAEVGATYQGLGGLLLGYELLGSDGGKARFVTPLATAHKFNGWADAFLDNGGKNGLQDLYVGITPVLPLGLKGGAFYHQFWSDEHGHRLGHEIDGILVRAFGPYITVLTKIAYFDGRPVTLPDRWRAWLEATFHF